MINANLSGKKFQVPQTDSEIEAFQTKFRSMSHFPQKNRSYAKTNPENILLSVETLKNIRRCISRSQKLKRIIC